MGRFDRLSDQISQIRDEMAMNFGATDHAMKATDHTRDELRSLADLVSLMQRQIHMLDGRVKRLEDRQP